MKITVYNTSVQKVTELYMWQSLVWDIKYNAIGEFVLELQQADGVLDDIQKDYYLTFSEDTSKTAMIVTAIEVADGIVTISGKSATWILTKRFYTSTVTSGTAETNLKSVIANMTAWTGLTAEASQGLMETYSEDITANTVDYIFQTITQACDLGYKICIENSGLVLKVYKGTQNTAVKYSQKYGNLGNEAYTIDTADNYNVAIVGGEGEGNNRVFVTVGETTATGANRKELFVDCGSMSKKEEETQADYEARLGAEGKNALVEHYTVEKISFEIADDEISLGEILSCKIESINVSLQTRAEELEITVQNNIKTVEVTVGDIYNIRSVK